MTDNEKQLAAHIHAADLEIARVMQRIAPIAGLLAARQRLKVALKLIEGEKVEETWTTEEILETEG